MIALPDRTATAFETRLDSVADIVRDRLPAFGSRPAIRYDDGEGYRTLDFGEYLANIRMMLPLLADRRTQCIVATCVENRPEWDMLAHAVLYTGNILFPLDTEMGDEELRHLLALSPPALVLVSAASRPRIRRLLTELGLAPEILVADRYHTFEDLGTSLVDDPPADERRLSALPAAPEGWMPPPSERLTDPDTVLAHYATSGTTDLPKVVCINHRNILAQLNEGLDVMKLRAGEDLLNIGAYTHIATMLEFLVTKVNGYSVTYVTRDIDEDGMLEREIRKLKRLGIRIKALMAVPKFWTLLLKEVLEEMKDKGVWRGLYRHLTSIERHEQVVDLGTIDKAKLNAVRIFLRNRMGGSFTYGITSSTRIDPGVVEIFGALGVTIIDIYGATEASGIIARNRLNESRRGSCGRIIEGLEYRIRDPRSIPGIPVPVGELLIRGATLAPGYVGTQPGSHLDGEGYLHTGDLAWVDDGGWLFLVGRAKEMIRWDDGSLIDRMQLSNLLVRSIWIRDALVTRIDGAEALSAFVLPDWTRIRKDQAYQAALAAGVSEHDALRTCLLEALDHAEALADITPVIDRSRIYLLDHKLARTPTHKIRFAAEEAALNLERYV